MDGSLDRGPQADRRRGRADVEDALSARHLQHVLIEVSQPNRRTVLYDSDDLERHVAVATTGAPIGSRPGGRYVLTKFSFTITARRALAPSRSSKSRPLTSAMPIVLK